MHDTQNFQEIIWDYYGKHGRDLPWRQPDATGTYDPYAIMVSELMLQQTQVGRVIEKYRSFMRRFPTVQALAEASLADVLTEWSGLGYNRRAKFLHEAVKQIHARGSFPDTLPDLTTLPGIGPNTAGAIMAYAYDEPIAFVETNIRSVYIYHFFNGQDKVSDKDISLKVVETLPADSARQWYWALMDYGSHLKKTVANHARASASYTKQSAFAGSKRQIRGAVLKRLTKGPASYEALLEATHDERLSDVLTQLCDEKMISLNRDAYQLGS